MSVRHQARARCWRVALLAVLLWPAALPSLALAAPAATVKGGVAGDHRNPHALRRRDPDAGAATGRPRPCRFRPMPLRRTGCLSVDTWSRCRCGAATERPAVRGWRTSDRAAPPTITEPA